MFFGSAIIIQNMETKRFQKKIEDFICAHCGKNIKGNGYTDHCPICLWSKHVDINPGDRRASCQGLMKPIGVEIKNKKYIIHYRCLKCGFQHQVKASSGDNLDKIIALTANPIE